MKVTVQNSGGSFYGPRWAVCTGRMEWDVLSTTARDYGSGCGCRVTAASTVDREDAGWEENDEDDDADDADDDQR